jgi:hypothetical protein
MPPIAGIKLARWISRENLTFWRLDSLARRRAAAQVIVRKMFDYKDFRSKTGVFVGVAEGARRVR